MVFFKNFFVLVACIKITFRVWYNRHKMRCRVRFFCCTVLDKSLRPEIIYLRIRFQINPSRALRPHIIVFSNRSALVLRIEIFVFL